MPASLGVMISCETRAQLMVLIGIQDAGLITLLRKTSLCNSQGGAECDGHDQGG